MAKKILVTAVDGNKRSKPFVLYETTDTELPKQFVLRLDDATDREGNEVIRVSNANIGLIASHRPDYITDILTGFRRNVKGTTVIICERFVDDIATLATARKSEVF